MIVGDSPQAMTVNLSVADAEKYLANRRAAGFNSAWVNLLCIICNSLAGGRADGTTYDGVRPFTTPGDLSTPNEAYFARVDRMVGLAAKYGIVLFLDPIETAGWLNILKGNSVDKADGYGRYLGQAVQEVPEHRLVQWERLPDLAESFRRGSRTSRRARHKGEPIPNHLADRRAQLPRQQLAR